jgi:hypothetical protein
VLPELKALAERLAVTDWATFTGWLDEDACFDYLGTADIGLDTNLQPEVSPVKGMEYMAFEVPFVAFDPEETKAVAEGAAFASDWATHWRLPGRLTSCWKIPPAAPRWRAPGADAWTNASPGIGRRKPILGSLRACSVRGGRWYRRGAGAHARSRLYRILWSPVPGSRLS